MLSDDIKKIYIGASPVQKMYLGSTFIYPREPADEYLMLGTTTGTTDFMVGTIIEDGYSPDCIKVHVVVKQDGINEMYVKKEDVPNPPFNLSQSVGFCSAEGKKILSISKWNIDTSNVTNMDSMFASCTELASLDVSNFNTSNVTTMNSMFEYCSGFSSLDLSNFNTSKVTDMSYMFFNCSSLNTIDLSGFDTSRVTSMTSFFSNCVSLTSLDVSNFDTTNCTDMGYMFCSCWSLTSLDLSNFNTSNVTNMTGMFAYDDKFSSIDLSNFNTSKVTSMSTMFSGCSSLKTLDLSNFNTSNVIDMSSMFSYCTAITLLDLRSFDTTKCTSMSYMFSQDYQLAKLYLSKNFFNSTTVTEYDLGDLDSWTDTESLAMFVEAITAHDGTGKTVVLSIQTQRVLTEVQINAITAKGWIIRTT